MLASFRFQYRRGPMIQCGWLLSTLCLLLPATALSAQETDATKFSIERLFESGEFNAEGAPSFQWSEQGSYYFQFQNASEGRGRDLVKVRPDAEEFEVVATAQELTPAGAERPLGPQSYEFSADESKLLLFTNTRRVWRQNTRGDYWVLDLRTKQLRQLGGDAPESSLMFAKFSPDGERVAYVRENNLYVEHLTDGRVFALTSDGSEWIINGTSDWVNEEELEIRDAFRWSPDGRSIAYWQFDTTEVPRFVMIDNTSEKYPTLQRFPYPKVGETNSAVRVGVVSAEGGETRWLQVPGDPRQNYIARVEWTLDGASVALQHFDRLQQNLQLMLADPISGEVRTVMTETDSAWVENDNPFRWIDDGRSIVWLSERSGWRHAYVVSMTDGQTRPLTSGEFDIIEIERVDAERRLVYFAASPDNATQRYLFAVHLDTGDLRQVSGTKQPGWHTYDISPDGSYANHSYSTFSTPPVHELVRLPDHEVIKTWTDNARLRERLATVEMPEAQLLRLDIGDGIELDACCLKPPGYDPTLKYPVFIYVYGEPWGQTVRDAWGGRQWLWHAMLAQHGYIVVSIDNRGTKVPRGREWRKSIYRQIGIQAPADQAAALDALCRQLPYADAERVGIWGWSGGGSMTLNALFRYPEKYHLGIAVAPEPNQLLYDTIYQERYMGLPSDNGDNFHEGSPVNHAGNLQGELLIIHGTADDNCHYQGTELLINQLVANKKVFSVIPYPGRSHGIYEGPGTTPHLYTTMTRFLLRGLPAGGRAPE
ncbi:MAG: S9 family peptidase [Planctomycetales bacterium]|nr:S9 family peptidase [Planctomycetales bacterium]